MGTCYGSSAILVLASLRSRRSRRTLANPIIRGDGDNIKDKAQPWLQNPQRQRRQVLAAVVGTYTVCSGTTAYCMQKGLLTKATGLTWEAYTILFGAGCLWQMLQAFAAAFCMHLRRPGCMYRGGEVASSTMAGLAPFVSDQYEIMKSVVFCALCLHGTSDSNYLLFLLGTLLWIYILAVRISYFCTNNDGCIQSLGDSHLAVWTCKTDDVGGPLLIVREERPRSLLQRACMLLIALAYKLMNPARRRMVILQSLPEALRPLWTPPEPRKLEE